MLSVTLLCTVDSKSPSTFLLAMESLPSGLLGIKLAMDVIELSTTTYPRKNNSYDFVRIYMSIHT